VRVGETQRGCRLTKRIIASFDQQQAWSSHPPSQDEAWRPRRETWRRAGVARPHLVDDLYFVPRVMGCWLSAIPGVVL